MNELNFCGIDVAKRSFVVGISSRKQTKTFTNNPKGIQQAVEYLKNCANLRLVVLESTGGLEIPLAKALHRADFRVVIANPRQTHQFAMAKSLAKTDAKDAKMLASYAKMLVLDDEVEKQLYLPPTPEMEQLEALVLRRTQLVEMRVTEKNRLHQVHDSQRESVQQLIAHFDRLIDELETQINQATAVFDDTLKKFNDIKGIGAITSATLM